MSEDAKHVGREGGGSGVGDGINGRCRAKVVVQFDCAMDLMSMVARRVLLCSRGRGEERGRERGSRLTVFDDWFTIPRVVVLSDRV